MLMVYIREQVRREGMEMCVRRVRDSEAAERGTKSFNAQLP